MRFGVQSTKSKFLQILAVALFALFGFAACGETEEENQANQSSAVEVRAIEILDADGEVVLDGHGNHWHGAPLVLDEGIGVEFSFRFLDADGEDLGIRGGEGGYRIDAQEHGASILDIEDHGDHVDITPTTSGTTELHIDLYYNDEMIYEAPDLTVVVQFIAEDG